MNVIIEIHGREALPVRALPWMTSWNFGSQEVAELLAGDLKWSIPVQARYLDASEVRNYPIARWKNTHTIALEELVATSLMRSEWETAATTALPAGVFVWRDEWEAAYNASPDGPNVLNEVAENIEDKEDVEGRTLNFNPCIPDKTICNLVLEGFILQDTVVGSLFISATKVATSSADNQPWLNVVATDPTPAQPWYTPARYFARKLVAEDTHLLLKKLILANKVSKSMFAVGIKKRGGRAALSAETVLKAFANVNLG